MLLKGQKLWRVARFVLLAVVVVVAVAYFYLWNVYYETLPRSPDSAVGRVYADNFHGFVLYETRQEFVRLHALEYSWEALAFVVVLGEALHEWRTRRARSMADIGTRC